MVFAVFSILALICLGLGVYLYKKDAWVYGSECILCFLFGMTCLLLAVFCGLSIGIEESIYTGYIYSVNDSPNRTTARIRFSEYASEVNPPIFCVKKEDGAFLKELAGSGVKVRVIVPADIKINDFWNCGIPAKIEVMEVNNE